MSRDVPSAADQAAAIQAALAPMRGVLDVVIGEVNQYRASLASHGYSDQACEKMAVEYHNALLKTMFAQISAGSKS